jgi:hypothetical protein
MPYITTAKDDCVLRQKFIKLQYLGFCKYLHECDKYNKKDRVLFITRAKFNKNKDEIFNKIIRLQENKVTAQEMDN